MSNHRSLLALAIPVCFSLLVGSGACSSESDGAPPAEAGTTSASKTIGPEGGSLVTSFGVTIEVPAGAVDAPVIFTAETVTDAPPPAPGTQAIGTTYKLGPPATTFKRPVKVTLALPTGAPTKDVVLLRLPEGATEWLPIAGLGGGGSSITGYTRSFSWFRTVQMLFEQAGCFVPTSCSMSCRDEAGGCSGSCTVRGTAISAGAVCSPGANGISCLCDAGSTGLVPVESSAITIDAADPLDWAVALYQIGTRCGWPCSGETDAGADAAPDGAADASNPLVDAGYTCSPPLVISKIFVNGGTSVSFPNNDFVEIHNRDAMPVNVSGLALQLNDGSSTGAWTVVPLTGTIAGGGFYLVSLGRDNDFTGTALPTPDATGSFNLPRGLTSGGGRVAITATTTPLTGGGPWAIVDGVAYTNTALTLEGAASTGNPNFGAMLRRVGGAGCTDTGNNATDVINANFLAPNNSASTPAACTCP